MSRVYAYVMEDVDVVRRANLGFTYFVLPSTLSLITHHFTGDFVDLWKLWTAYTMGVVVVVVVVVKYGTNSKEGDKYELD